MDWSKLGSNNLRMQLFLNRFANFFLCLAHADWSRLRSLRRSKGSFVRTWSSSFAGKNYATFSQHFSGANPYKSIDPSPQKTKRRMKTRRNPPRPTAPTCLGPCRPFLTSRPALATLAAQSEVAPAQPFRRISGWGQNGSASRSALHLLGKDASSAAHTPVEVALKGQFVCRLSWVFFRSLEVDEHGQKRG